MAGRIQTGSDVLSAALDRIRPFFERGDRVVVAWSGGKDSTVCLELCLEVARETGRLPLDVVMLDVEAMLPGTFELAEELAERSEIDFHWYVFGEPQLNVFNRANPYWWAFDDRLDPSEWMRQPPPYARWERGTNSLYHLTSIDRFPPPPGKETINVLGTRADESARRLLGIHSSGGALSRGRSGSQNLWPIYDWTTADVWRAIKLHRWPYNRAYDTLMRLGLPTRLLRIAPPTMSLQGVETLQLAAKAWPRWFDKLCERAPGCRLAVHYGKRAVQPQRRPGETWEECYERTCIRDAPPWIAARARKWREIVLRYHARHSAASLPDLHICKHCPDQNGSWKKMAHNLYNGDPFGLVTKLPWLQPSYFRPGAPDWQGSPAGVG